MSRLAGAKIVGASQIRLYNPREIQMDLDGLAFRDDGGGSADVPPPANFDLVVANILIGPLIRLAPVCLPTVLASSHHALSSRRRLRGRAFLTCQHARRCFRWQCARARADCA